MKDMTGQSEFACLAAAKQAEGQGKARLQRVRVACHSLLQRSEIFSSGFIGLRHYEDNAACPIPGPVYSRSSAASSQITSNAAATLSILLWLDTWRLLKN